MTSHLLAAAASVALLGAGFTSVDGTRSASALPGAQTLAAADSAGGNGNKCRVDVIRTGTAGVADVVRSADKSGCVCTVTTGQASANGAAESVVTAVLSDRTCEGAPTTGQQVAKAASAGGGASFVLPVLVSTVGAAGLGVAAGNDSKS